MRPGGQPALEARRRRSAGEWVSRRLTSRPAVVVGRARRADVAIAARVPVLDTELGHRHVLELGTDLGVADDRHVRDLQLRPPLRRGPRGLVRPDPSDRQRQDRHPQTGLAHADVSPGQALRPFRSLPLFAVTSRFDTPAGPPQKAHDNLTADSPGGAARTPIEPSIPSPVDRIIRRPSSVSVRPPRRSAAR